MRVAERCFLADAAIMESSTKKGEMLREVESATLYFQTQLTGRGNVLLATCYVLRAINSGLALWPLVLTELPIRGAPQPLDIWSRCANFRSFGKMSSPCDCAQYRA